MLTLRGEHFYFGATPLYTRGLGFHLANKLQVIPLGGLGEFGMHMMALRYGDDIIVIDSGMA